MGARGEGIQNYFLVYVCACMTMHMYVYLLGGKRMLAKVDQTNVWNVHTIPCS